MANFDALPNELIARIVSFSDRKSLSNLRLTSSKIEVFAVEKLFERVTLYAHWAEPDEEWARDQARFFPENHDGTFNEDFPIGRSSIRRARQVLQEDEEDGFIPGSDEDEEDVEIESDPQEADRRMTDPSFDRDNEDDEDGFTAGLDVGEFLRPGVAENEEDLFTQRQRPPGPIPVPPGFVLHEMQRRQAQEAARPQWARDYLTGPPGYDAAMFLNILENDRLRKFVKDVQVYTCETHCDHHPQDGAELYGDSWPVPRFHPRYLSSIQRIGEFPNACRLTVHFDRHSADGNDDEFFQDSGFQYLQLERIVEAARDTTHLAVRHFENPRLQEGAKLDFPRLLRQIALASSLRLSVKHAETHPDAGSTYRLGRIHEFWHTFPVQVLAPASNLTTLVLYSDIPIGWFPKLDLRAVHLPKLISLTLGHHILHNDRQVDWIMSHRETLRDLTFDRCAILYQIGCTIPDWLDHDGYPRKEADDEGTYGLSYQTYDSRRDTFLPRPMFFRSNNIRWNAVFARLASLPHLYEFRFGASLQWDFDTMTTLWRTGNVKQMPIMPWEDEHNIKNSLFQERYVVWNDWEEEYQPTWETTNQRFRQSSTRMERYPDVGKEDEEALQALLEIVKGR